MSFLCGPNVNYFAVTYQGPVNWWQKSTVGTDDDYNYRMYPSNNNGLVGNNPSVDGTEIEFDSDETIDHFSSPLWTTFHQMVDNYNFSRAAIHLRQDGRSYLVARPRLRAPKLQFGGTSGLRNGRRHG